PWVNLREKYRICFPLEFGLTGFVHCAKPNPSRISICLETEAYEHSGDTQTDQWRDRRLGGCDRAGSPCPSELEIKVVFGRPDRLRGRTELACVAGGCGHAWHASGHQRRMRQAGGAQWPRAERKDQSALGVRSQELFLS